MSPRALRDVTPDNHDNNNNTTIHHRNKRIRIMADSGQTDADRRALRSNLRQLQKTILHKSEDMENVFANSFEQMREQSNKLFDRVAYTREAVLDGENVEMISAHAVRQVDKLVQVPRYDAVRLSRKLVKKCSRRVGGSLNFDWKTLGYQAGACFNAIPSRVTFLSGPLGADYKPKERKPRAPRIVEDDDSEQEEEEPEEVVSKQKSTANQLSAVERNMKVLSKTLTQRCKANYAEQKALLDQQEFDSDEERNKAKKLLSKKGYDIDAIQYLFNPDSFTETVENIFHFSFLIKKGDAKIGLDKNKGPTVRSVRESTKVQQDRQAVLAFSMQDWRELCKATNLTKGDIPSRSSKKRSRGVVSPE